MGTASGAGRSRLGRRAAFACALLAGTLAAVTCAEARKAATNPKIWVTSSADVGDANPGDGLCRVKLLTKPGSPPRCTLRAAIQTANSRPGPDIVVLPAGVFPLSVKGEDEGVAASGDLDVTSGPLVVLGKGPGQTIIDAKRRDRIFEIHPLGGNLTLQSIALRNGDVGGGSDGGAVLVRGTFNARHVVITGSGTPAGTHGGIYATGGAIHVEKGGRATLERTSLVGNHAPLAAALSVDGEASLLNVTVSGNVGPNHAQVSQIGVTGSLRIVHSTVVAESGSAIWYMGAAARVNQLASIVVGPCNADFETFLGAGNAVTMADCAPLGTASHQGVSDTVFADVGLAPLSDGPLPVHPLRAGSPAIDRGNGVPEVCPPADALGLPRPAGRACDAGAVEYRRVGRTK